MVYVSELKTKLGLATASVEGGALTGFRFIGQKYCPQKTENWIQMPTHPVFRQLEAWLESYFAGRNPVPDFVLNPQGTVFQKKVWKVLLRIPYGEITTYGKIAGQLTAREGQDSMSARAVGGAVGHNPISLLIPCHRVVGANGGLTGYAGGLDRKTALLRLEGANPQQTGTLPKIRMRSSRGFYDAVF
ncbi:MAG: methylated-DNA--[protein]-cysteine S-methyltransferase [Desulfovibrio sp.]|jgi:methylated-DNA-[protein]-cysteine S-methyltransferase|nr:methylated-DNA--[protein]-cysteine S-methyltransferase [Desulfovibrio sp.]